MVRKVFLLFFVTLFLLSLDRFMTLSEEKLDKGESFSAIDVLFELTGVSFICEKFFFCSKLEARSSYNAQDNTKNNAYKLILLNKEEIPTSVKGVIKKRDLVIDLKSNRNIYWVSSKKALIDSTKEKIFYETIPAFIDIVKAKARVDSEKIFAKIDLLSYISPHIALDGSEARKYQVEFFIRDNVSVEIGFGIQTFDSQEIVEYFYLNYKDGDNDDYIEYDNVEDYVRVVGDSIIFNVPKSLSSYLDDITPLSKVHFWTWYNIENINKAFYDNCPN